ncbi:anchored repeat-type ABC transporter ATP-binding subunit [Actinomyces sp. B33]|uniref:anchored repeat-type ABC transporter ATP-binding subunit n=1 Tax=Actinomyces sp. B33 TaxID=2942131 RepID=UPI002340195C|nr:anchored repeat-type ABC transporter ATP-binding subunit [Actinomyces sp. B33]MDC4232527.1 anchored repeat-type ABC transporter ATP-binding subunit [Actinomyces sp. B33]
MRALSVRGLGVDLGGRAVLRDVDLEIDAGELVGLIGPNGAGKTTLLRAVLGLIPAVAGAVEHAGAPDSPDAGGPRARRPGRAGVGTSIGYVPQRHEFAWDFPMSVRDAVLGAITVRLGLLARPRIAHHRAVERALARTGMSDLGDRPVGELSGGQRQRVLVARALALEPSVLLLDEPFTGLDMPTQELLMDLFRDLAGEGCAVLMTTHDLIGARAQCDRLYLVNRTVVASGTPAELSDADTWIRTFAVRPDNPLLAALGVS